MYKHMGAAISTLVLNSLKMHSYLSFNFLLHVSFQMRRRNMRTMKVGGEIVRKRTPITAYPGYSSEKVAEGRN